MSVSERDEGSGRLKGAILIAGPTASGKSALALALAERLGGAIVNTDSMQGYSVLRLLTARPTEADLARVPHHLFGHVPPTDAYSTGRWLRDVMGLIDGGRLDGKIPIFVGGTGLYFRALLGGLSEIPEIAPHIRERWRYRLLEEGATHLHSILNREDPAAAVRIRPNDGQRLVRALEVLESTGRSILDWQSVRGRALVDRASAKLAVLDPDRAELRGRIATRFEVMLKSGAVQEALAVDALALDPQLPAAKAIGLREMVDFASGRLDGHEAVTRAVIASHQYAKRQATWFRTQFDAAWRRFPAFGDALAGDPWFDVGGSGVG